MTLFAAKTLDSVLLWGERVEDEELEGSGVGKDVREGVEEEGEAGKRGGEGRGGGGGAEGVGT